MMKRLLLAAAVLAMGALAAQAKEFSAADEHARAVPVRFDDLDLTRAEDAAAMLSRLRYATTRACALEEVRRPGPAVRRAIDDCRRQALDEAIAELGAPELTRLYADIRR